MPTRPSSPPTSASIWCPSIVCVLMTVNSSCVSGPRRLMISLSIVSLPTSCSSAANSSSMPVLPRHAQLVADLHREVDDAAAVLAREPVVGRDHAVEQQRGAAVGARQLDALLDPQAAVAGEGHQQADQRQHEQERVGGERGGEATSSPTHDSSVSATQIQAELARPRAAAACPARARGGRSRSRCRRRTARPARAGRPASRRTPGVSAPASPSTSDRADRVERVAELHDRAVDRRVARQVARQPAEQQPRRDEQRHRGRRQQEQHRDEHELGGDRRGDAALELDPRSERVEQRERDGGRHRQLLLGGQQHEQRGGGEHEQGGEGDLDAQLAAGQRSASVVHALRRGASAPTPRHTAVYRTRAYARAAQRSVGFPRSG